MKRMALLPPKAPAESVSVLRKAFDALSRDQDFLQDAITAMRFQPRFEVSEAGEAPIPARLSDKAGNNLVLAGLYRSGEQVSASSLSALRAACERPFACAGERYTGTRLAI